ncbi:MAG: SWIM zinc finger family protein [Janthinobacterium lividum]
MFTQQYLKSLATATSFSRGKEYFRAGSVGKISRDGDKFMAKVHGTYPYKVQLTLKAGGAKLKCTCPYDFEGLCKHEVALGLAVLQQFGPSLAASSGQADTLDASPAALETALRDTAAGVQLAFLAGLLRQDDTLRRQFLLHVGPAPGAAPAPPAAPAEATVESISTEVFEALSDLEFDDELLSEHAEFYEDYLDDEGDAMLELADQAIDEVLAPHAEAVAAALRGGQLAEALRRWVGVYEGSAAATEPQADDYDLFSYEGYAGHVQARWLHVLGELGVDEQLENKQFALAETQAALALIFGHYQEPAILPKVLGGQRVTLIRPQPLLNLPPHFHDLLHTLAHDPATAAQLRPLLEPVLPPDVGLARVLLRVAEVLADDALWLRTAEAFAAQDATLTSALLDRYRQRGDRPSLLRVLNERRPQYPAQLNPYVLSYITPAEDESLYLAALEQRCRSNQSLADYHELRGYWSAPRRQAFVQEQLLLSERPGAHALFGAELLAAENRDAELVPYLLRRNWAWERSVPEILALAARTRPDECLDAVMERTEALLQDAIGGRGRDVYQRLVSWLVALNGVEELRPQVALFAAHLYTEYARLNALREELRGARLVRTEVVGKQHKLLISDPAADELRALLRDKRTKPDGKRSTGA